jgi:hypothetical protein
MTYIKAGTLPCQSCGKDDELRPYGPNGEWICFDCGMRDETTTKGRFGAILESGTLHLDITDNDGDEIIVRAA